MVKMLTENWHLYTLSPIQTLSSHTCPYIMKEYPTMLMLRFWAWHTYYSCTCGEVTAGRNKNKLRIDPCSPSCSIAFSWYAEFDTVADLTPAQRTPEMRRLSGRRRWVVWLTSVVTKGNSCEKRSQNMYFLVANLLSAIWKLRILSIQVVSCCHSRLWYTPSGEVQTALEQRD